MRRKEEALVPHPSLKHRVKELIPRALLDMNSEVLEEGFRYLRLIFLDTVVFLKLSLERWTHTEGDISTDLL